MPDSNASLATRLSWVTGIRLVVLNFMLVAIATLYLRGTLSQYPISLTVLLVMLALAFAFAGAFAVLLRTRRYLVTLAYGQIVIDQLTWTALVYVSGGITSGATSFYALTALVGALLVGLRGAIVGAALGMGLFTLLTVLLRFGLVPAPADQNATYALAQPEALFSLLVNGLGIVVVALLAGYLSERLRLTGGALELARRRAQEAERLAALGRLAAGLAHEIRNPLGAIRGSVELLAESPVLSDEEHRLCDIVLRETQRLNHLVDDMMDLSRPRPPKVEAVDVAALARDVVRLAGATERALDVEVRYDGPEGSSVLCRCDPEQMRQVLWNLVRNAIQASPPGKCVTVRVVTGDPVRLEVIDHGPGIPPDGRARIFDTDYTTRKVGTGIGLAVVRRIVEEHMPFGATIDVRSAEGEGTTFSLKLAAAQTVSGGA